MCFFIIDLSILSIYVNQCASFYAISIFVYLIISCLFIKIYSYQTHVYQPLSLFIHPSSFSLAYLAFLLTSPQSIDWRETCTQKKQRNVPTKPVTCFHTPEHTPETKMQRGVTHFQRIASIHQIISPSLLLSLSVCVWRAFSLVKYWCSEFSEILVLCSNTIAKFLKIYHIVKLNIDVNTIVNYCEIQHR